MKVMYIQPIFAPNLKMAERNHRSIVSFFQTYHKNNYTFKCVFGGYATSDELFDYIRSTIIVYSAGCDIEVIRYDKNYGKGYIVNDLTSRFLGDCDYFLTADSDILFKPNDNDFMGRLVEAFDKATELNLNPSLIALYQEEGNCHILELCYENKYYYQGEYEHEMVCHPNDGYGVAGGCIFIKSEFWRKVNGYKVLGVYAGDDSTLMRESYQMGYKYLMSNSIRCIHPIEDDDSYARWKVAVCPKSQVLDVAVQEAEAFWNSKR